MNRSAVIFDLDGTLTKPYLDFDAIREEIGIPSGPILEAIETLAADAQPQARATLERHEWDAARNAQLYDGAQEIVAHCRERGRPVALLTRNTRPVVDHIIRTHGLVFDAIRTREDGAIKPSPLPVVSICQELRADPAASWVVGDYLFDLLCGRAAGTRTVLMIGDAEVPSYASHADFVIRRLPELKVIVS
jgi:HAD superfamily hydrolase (TIGR01549 family)